MIMRRVTNKHIKAFAAALMIMASGMALNAQTLPSLLLDQDPVAISSGMASVASEADAYALQNNVAAISLSEQTMSADVGIALLQPSYAKLKMAGVGAMYRFGKLGVGLDLKMLMMPSYGGVTGGGADIRDSEFSPSELSFSAGVSYALMDCLSAGATLRYVGSKLSPDASAGVFGADVAVYFKKNGIRAGLSVNNIGTKVKYSETAYPQPMMAKVGAGYDLELGTSSLAFNAEADVLFARGLMAGAGCEYSFKDMAFVRAGYHYGNSANAVPSFASAGIGVKLFGVNLDLAYMFASEVLANSMCVSLGYSF